MAEVSTIWTTQFVSSIIISAIMAGGFMYWQWKEFKANKKALEKLGLFFSKAEEYATSEKQLFDGRKTVTNILIKDVAGDESELKNLIVDINSYIAKSKGTVAFSIIQNKTERRISMLYEMATSKLSFPTHIGLMGTFAGVFLGLTMFLIGTLSNGEITDSSIQSLITGVLVSMITSFYGILLLILSHKAASLVSNKVDFDKNEFYEWVQNELMPSVDVTMVEAIGKLHETIDQFEPTFSGVISEFKNAFRDVTGAFGSDFRESVKIVSSAVKRMGDNMDAINKNIRFQEELLGTIRSQELIKGMDAFVEASHKFSEITGSLDQFERARRLMLVAAQETINIQTRFNESLAIPKEVAADINSILDRVRNFEKRINEVGEAIAQGQIVGSKVVGQIEENINAIKKKQKIAKDYAEAANEKLQDYFEEHKIELGAIAKRYNEALENYLADYENMLKERKDELENRKREFTDAIDQKLSLDEIRSEFTSLKKLNAIADKVEQLAKNAVTGEKLNKALDEIRLELNAMAAAQSKGGGSSYATDKIMQARDKALQEAEVAKQNEAIAKQQGELLKQQFDDLNRRFIQLNGYVESLARNRQVQQTTNTPQVPVPDNHPVNVAPPTTLSHTPTDVGKPEDGTKPGETEAPTNGGVEKPDDFLKQKRGFWDILLRRNRE